jgi:hypothetical protein
MYMIFCTLYSVFCFFLFRIKFCSVCSEFYVIELPGPIAPIGDFKIVVGGDGMGGWDSSDITGGGGGGGRPPAPGYSLCCQCC